MVVLLYVDRIGFPSYNKAWLWPAITSGHIHYKWALDFPTFNVYPRRYYGLSTE
jgi:hypothetical protein